MKGKMVGKSVGAGGGARESRAEMERGVRTTGGAACGVECAARSASPEVVEFEAPETVYQTVMDAEGRQDGSAPLVLRAECGARWSGLGKTWGTGEEGAPWVDARCVSASIRRVDGRVVEVWHADSLCPLRVPVDMVGVRVEEAGADAPPSLVLEVKRKHLPPSKNHGETPFVLLVVVRLDGMAPLVLRTQPFFVCSKQSVKTERRPPKRVRNPPRSKPYPVADPVAEPEDELFDRVLGIAGSKRGRDHGDHGDHDDDFETSSLVAPPPPRQRPRGPAAAPAAPVAPEAPAMPSFLGGPVDSLGLFDGSGGAPVLPVLMDDGALGGAVPRLAPLSRGLSLPWASDASGMGRLPSDGGGGLPAVVRPLPRWVLSGDECGDTPRAFDVAPFPRSFSLPRSPSLPSLAPSPTPDHCSDDTGSHASAAEESSTDADSPALPPLLAAADFLL